MAIEDEYRHTYTNVQVRAIDGCEFIKSTVDITNAEDMFINEQSIEKGFGSDNMVASVWSPEQCNIYVPDSVYRRYSLWRHK